MSLADDYVRRVFDELLARREIEHHTWLLAQCGPDAMPVLLENLACGEFERRKIALYGLQYCWSPEAREPVEKLLGDPDERLRDMAAAVLNKHLGQREILRHAKRLFRNSNKDVAGWALTHLEAQDPNYERVRKALDDLDLAPWLWKYLPRYQAPELAAPTRRMLAQFAPDGEENAHIVAACLVALAQQNDRSPEARRMAHDALRHAVPRVREAAAEYLAWHGHAASAEALRVLGPGEEDAYVRATFEHACKAIAARPTPLRDATGEAELSAEDARLSALERYQHIGAWLEDDPSREAAERAFALFRHAEAMEPYWTFKGKEAKEDFAALRTARLAAQAKLFAFSGPEELTHHAPFDAPICTRIIGPVRKYLDPNRTSFAWLSDSTNTSFKGQVHVGDDVAWFQDYAPVICVADGLVRRAGHSPSWGYMVVVEHRTRGGEFFCSLYAHLSPFLCVRAGDAVALGQRLGGVGRSFTWENGGYAAHLHFALHQGPFFQLHPPGAKVDVRYKGRHYTGTVMESNREETVARIDTWLGTHYVTTPTTWIRGYVSIPQWQASRHRFMNPQDVIRRNCPD